LFKNKNKEEKKKREGDKFKKQKIILLNKKL